MKDIWLQTNHYFSQIWSGWTIKLPLSMAAGFYTGYLGGDWLLLLIFSAMIAIDLVFGSWLAIKNRNFDLKLFGHWVVKVGTHFFVIFIVGISIKAVLGPMAINFPLLDLFLGMLICTESLSILKNMQRLGLPVPKLATRILMDIRKQAEENTSVFFNRPENDRRKNTLSSTKVNHMGDNYDKNG